MPSDLVQLSPGVHYLPGAVNQLVLEDGAGGALIVDSGLDEARGKLLLRALAARALTPRGLLNTHSHADHYGGNAVIEARAPGIEVFAPPLEEAVLRYPMLEPLFLFGARPPGELQNKFLMARASRAITAPGPGPVELAGVTLELIEVAGHANMMFAVRAGDVLFAADALFGPEVLAKHPLTFCADSALQKSSARELGALTGVRVTLPGHGEPTGDLAALVRVNLATYARTTETVRRAAREPGSLDELLARVCDDLNIHMTTPGEVVLNRAAVGAHLVELAERGEVKGVVRDNRWLWWAV